MAFAMKRVLFGFDEMVFRVHEALLPAYFSLRTPLNFFPFFTPMNRPQSLLRLVHAVSPLSF